MTDKEIPSVAFWAHTATQGMQLVEGDSELGQRLTSTFGEGGAPKPDPTKIHKMNIGSIMVAGEGVSLAFAPEDAGIPRELVVNYPEVPEA